MEQANEANTKEASTKKRFTLKTPFVDSSYQTYTDLFSQIQQIVFALENELISDAEFIATYILIFIQHQALLKKAKDLKISKEEAHRQSIGDYITGLLQSSIEPTKFPYKKPLKCKNHFQTLKEQEEYLNTNKKEGKYVKESEGDTILPPFTQKIYGIKFHEKELKRFAQLSKKVKEPLKGIASLYKHFNFKGLPLFVNKSIVHWDAEQRPFRIMFYLPCPKEVLDLQCDGRRCLTVFVKYNELGATFKDPYPPYEERDVLSFLFHDLQHMERFSDPKYYCEQVGFQNLHKIEFQVAFSHFLRKIQYHTLFSSFGKEWKDDFDHASSDMNSCCTHLLGFLKAKWKVSEWIYLRKIQGIDTTKIGYLTDEEEKNFDLKFSELLKSVGVPSAVLDASNRLCRVITSFSDEDGTCIRKYFHDLGNDVLELQEDKFPFS